MSEEAGLLAAIYDAPDDDGPRLVYADWLQSKNDPRGELIQLQCQIASTPPDDDRRRGMRIAENKLLKAHGAQWIDPIKALLPEPGWIDQYKFELVRGFVERVAITSACLDRLDALFEACPLIRDLEYTGATFDGRKFTKPNADGLLASPHVAKLRALRLGMGGGGNALARSVAGCDKLANLVELEIHGSVWGEQATMFDVTEDLRLDDDGAIALAGSPHLAKVEILDLENNRITPTGVMAIGNAAWRLKELDLANNSIDGPIAAALEGRAFETLEKLRLDGSQISVETIEELARAPRLANLVELDLESCKLGAMGTAALCRSLKLPALRRLRIERNSLGDAGALSVASCAAFAQLTDLEMGHNRIGAKGGAALAASAHLSNLERITLNEPRWKAETEELFAASTTLAKAKIYLGGKLLAAAKRKAATSAAEAAAADAANAADAADAADEAKPVKAKKSTKTITKTATTKTATAKKATTKKTKTATTRTKKS